MPTRCIRTADCAPAPSGAASTAPRPVTKARRFINPTDPPPCEGPVEADRPPSHAARPARVDAVYRSTQPDTNPSTPSAGPSKAGHSRVRGTARMVLERPPEAHVRLLRRFQVVGWARHVRQGYRPSGR